MEVGTASMDISPIGKAQNRLEPLRGGERALSSLTRESPKLG